MAYDEIEFDCLSKLSVEYDEDATRLDICRGTQITRIVFRSLEAIDRFKKEVKAL